MGTPPAGGILGTGAHGACVQIHNILASSPSASMTSCDATPCIPPAFPCSRDSSWQHVQGEVGAFGARSWAGFRGPFCPWLQLGMVSGGLCQGGRGAQGSCLVLSLMPRKWCFSPRQRVFCPRGWIHLRVDTRQRVTRAAGGEEQRVPTPHLWAGGACGVQVTPWV